MQWVGSASVELKQIHSGKPQDNSYTESISDRC